MRNNNIDPKILLEMLQQYFHGGEHGTPTNPYGEQENITLGNRDFGTPQDNRGLFYDWDSNPEGHDPYMNELMNKEGRLSREEEAYRRDNWASSTTPNLQSSSQFFPDSTKHSSRSFANLASGNPILAINKAKEEAKEEATEPSNSTWTGEPIDRLETVKMEDLERNEDGDVIPNPVKNDRELASGPADLDKPSKWDGLVEATDLFNSINPWGTSMEEDLARAGRQLTPNADGTWRKGSRLAGAFSLGTAALEGTRSFLSGRGKQKRYSENFLAQQMNDRKTYYNPVSQSQEGTLGDGANAEFGGLFSAEGGGMSKPGYHTMPDGSIMKNSEHVGSGGYYAEGGDTPPAFDINDPSTWRGDMAKYKMFGYNGDVNSALVPDYLEEYKENKITGVNSDYNTIGEFIQANEEWLSEGQKNQGFSNLGPSPITGFKYKEDNTEQKSSTGSRFKKIMVKDSRGQMGQVYVPDNKEFAGYYGRKPITEKDWQNTDYYNTNANQSDEHGKILGKFPFEREPAQGNLDPNRTQYGKTAGKGWKNQWLINEANKADKDNGDVSVASVNQYGGVFGYENGGGPDDPPKKTVYNTGIEEYNYFKANPSMWKEDPEMRNEDGSLNLCLDCIKVDWTNEDDVRGAAQLINEGYSQGTHYSIDQFNESLEKFGIQAPVFGSTRPNPTVAGQRYGGMFGYENGGAYDPIETGEGLLNDDNFIMTKNRYNGMDFQKEISERKFNRLRNRYERQGGSEGEEDYTTVHKGGRKSVSGKNPSPELSSRGLFSGGLELGFGSTGGGGGFGVPKWNEGGMQAQGQAPDIKNDPRFQPGEYIEFEYGGNMHKGIISSNNGESIELKK